MSYFFTVAEGGETESCGGRMGAKVSLYITLFHAPNRPGRDVWLPHLTFEDAETQRVEATCPTAEVSGCHESPQ